MDFAQAVRVLDQLYEFSRAHHVQRPGEPTAATPCSIRSFTNFTGRPRPRLSGRPACNSMPAGHIERLLAIARPALPGGARGLAPAQRLYPRRGPFRPNPGVPRSAARFRHLPHGHAHPHPRKPAPGAGPGRTAARSGGPVHLEPVSHGRRGAAPALRGAGAPALFLPPISTYYGKSRARPEGQPVQPGVLSERAPAVHRRPHLVSAAVRPSTSSRSCPTAQVHACCTSPIGDLVHPVTARHLATRGQPGATERAVACRDRDLRASPRLRRGHPRVRPRRPHRARPLPLPGLSVSVPDFVFPSSCHLSGRTRPPQLL